MSYRVAHKLFIGNLPWTIGQKELQLYFSKFGHVTWTSVVFDKQQGFSKGYGFVMFSSREGLNAANKQSVHRLDGRVLNVQAATT